MAAILIYELIGWKREIFDYYQEALGHIPGIEFMPEAAYGRSNRWLTVILITPEEFGADREEVRLALEAENIEARPVWPPAPLPARRASRPEGRALRPLARRGTSLRLGEKPMHLQPVFNPQITPQRNRLRISQGKQITQIDGKEKRYKARPSEIRSDKLNTRCCDFVNLTRQAVVNEFHGVKVIGGKVAGGFIQPGSLPAIRDADDRGRSRSGGFGDSKM